MKTDQKRIRIAVAALLAGMLLLCVLFIVAEGHHHCCGDECVVCACIRQCERILHPLTGSRASFDSTAIMAPALALGIALLWGLLAGKDSPVAVKVRIND